MVRKIPGAKMSPSERALFDRGLVLFPVCLPWWRKVWGNFGLVLLRRRLRRLP